MKAFGGFGSAPAIVLGGVGIGVVGALVALSPSAPDEERADSQAPAATISSSDPAPALSEPAPAATAQSTEPATDAAPQAQAPATPTAPQFPKIDTFRLAPDGEMIVAGQGEPGWDVSILLDDENIATPMADTQGKFVAFLSLPQSDAPRVLSLSMRSSETGEERRSRDRIIIAPTPPGDVVATADAPKTQEREPIASEPETPKPSGNAADMAAVETSDTGAGAPPPSDGADADPLVGATDRPGVGDVTETAALTAPPVTGQAPVPASRAVPSEVSEVAETPVNEAPAKAGSIGQTVLLADEQGVRVLQNTQAGPAPEAMTQVALDTISYTEAGEVALSGRAPAAHVRIYLDNAPISDTPVAPDGNWRVELPEVDTGVYTLRVDAVDDTGAVTSRVETPFKREDDAVLAARDTQMARDAAARIVTVQPGSTLWAISRETYGRGILYVRVFEANRDQIRDPDLIYPGQVFSLPR